MNTTEWAHLRLIANPHKLRPMVDEITVIKTSSFESDISKMIQSEYEDIYVNTYLIRRIKQVIQKEVKEYMIDTIVSEIISDATETAIRDALPGNGGRIQR